MRRKTEYLLFTGQSQDKDMLLLFHDVTSKFSGTSGSDEKQNKSYSSSFSMC